LAAILLNSQLELGNLRQIILYYNEQNLYLVQHASKKFFCKFSHSFYWLYISLNIV